MRMLCGFYFFTFWSLKIQMEIDTLTGKICYNVEKDVTMLHVLDPQQLGEARPQGGGELGALV